MNLTNAKNDCYSKLETKPNLLLNHFLLYVLMKRVEEELLNMVVINMVQEIKGQVKDRISYA